MKDTGHDAPRTTTTHRWYQRIGPGLITACVVIGPGSILTSSKVGAAYGFTMSWIVLVAVVFMMVYTTLGARLGVIASASPGTLVAERLGRPVAILIGGSVFFIATAFQFGNNLGVAAAFAEFDATLQQIPFYHIDALVVLFNLLSIAFLFIFRDFYKVLERLMMAFVALMLLSFAINLLVAQPPWVDLLRGLIPPVARLVGGAGADEGLDVSLLGLVGTTFVVAAAYYQAYLVRQKGWGSDELREGLLDARVGALVMATITLMLISTAAAELQGQQLQSVGDVARGLRPTFGSFGHFLFCQGLFAAAYSSFLVNSMVGGFTLADGLGWGITPDRWLPRLLTTATLLIGMLVALAVRHAKFDPVPAIVAAQAVTVVAAPLVAAVLWWLTSRADVMGDRRNGVTLNVLAFLGFVILLTIAWYTATYKVWPQLQTWWFTD